MECRSSVARAVAAGNGAVNSPAEGVKMAPRLGYFLYWICCGLAGLCLVGVFAAVGVLIASYSVEPLDTAAGAVLYAIGALAFWGIGRAARYILAGN
jgi:hypothetical protein